jgi:putative ABC transport system permease protein
MFVTHIRQAWRNIRKKKIYSIISLLGLSVSAAFCFLIYLYVQHERSFDAFHQNSAQLYRLEASDIFSVDSPHPSKSVLSFLLNESDDDRRMLIQPYILAEDIQKQFPEVTAYVRMQEYGPVTLWYNNQSFKLDDNKTSFVESNFFEVFDFPLLAGSTKQVLKGKYQAVISQQTAKRLFGNENAVGKVIQFAKTDSVQYTVSGVMKDMPANSSFQYDVLLPLEANPSHLEECTDRSNNHFNYTTLLLMQPGTDMLAFSTKLSSFSKQYFAASIREWQSYDSKRNYADFHLSLRPFTAAHFNPSTPWGHYSNRENIYELSVLAFIILMIACVNYILHSLTNSLSRSQEIGIRKTMGASRKQIAVQFLIETGLLSLMAVGLGCLLSIYAIPAFNQLAGARLQLTDLSVWTIAVGATILTALLTLMAGLYPAFVMSGLKPLGMLRRFASIKISPMASHGLIIVQYTICVILLISALVIGGQMNYMNRMDLGFNKEKILLVENPYEPGSTDWTDLFARFKQLASTEPAIADVSAGNGKFGPHYSRNGHLINGERVLLYQITVDTHYFAFMHIRKKAGRFFSPDRASDTAYLNVQPEQVLDGTSIVNRAVVVNNELYQLLGRPTLDEINPSLGARIIGVCDDYQFLDATQKVAPAYHVISRHGFKYWYARINPGVEIPGTVQQIKKDWDLLTGKQPFVYTFADDELNRSLTDYFNWLHIIRTAALLAVLVAGLGLFGLSALYAANRTKEICIRKILGASLSDLFLLLNKKMLWLVLMAFLIATPIAVYFMQTWLQHFQQRITLHGIYFIGGGLIALLLALASVSYHSLKAGWMNPAQKLRSE